MSLTILESGRSRARRSDAIANEQRIIDAAVSVFARDPYASMADVADAAQIGRATLYRHFPTRAQLLDAAVVADRVIERAEEAVSAALADPGRIGEARERVVLALHGARAGDNRDRLDRLRWLLVALLLADESASSSATSARKAVA